MHRNRVAIAGLSLAAILVAAWGGGGAARPAASGEPPASEGTGDKPLLTFVAQIDNPSQAFSWKMYQQNAAEYGFEVAVCDNKGDVQQQTTCINDAVAAGTDAIAINPVDEAGYVPATTAAMEQGVVVCLSMVPPAEEARDGSTCSVSVDDIKGGETAAAAIIEAFPDGATGVEIGGQAGHVAANNRHTGFTAGIEGEDITVLETTRTRPRGTPPRPRSSPRT
jgi:ABC-type sugar transport system substrate-binding protein